MFFKNHITQMSVMFLKRVSLFELFLGNKNGFLAPEFPLDFSCFFLSRILLLKL